MRHTRRSGLATLVATGGALALAASYAYADSEAAGVAAESPGLVSGNAVQLPVNVPVNVCGNTVNVVGLLNPAAGNTCANKGGGKSAHKDKPGTPHNGSGTGSTGAGSGNGGGATAEGVTAGSAGVISGNGVQLPVDLPVNVSGNSVNFVGVLNPVFGNASSNGGSKTPVTPPKPSKPENPVTPPKADKPTAPLPDGPEVSVPRPGPGLETSTTPLAETGSDSDLLAVGLPAALSLMLGGAVLYRRSRRAARDAA
ncbi:chaplin family protein [Streptomyces sp. NRRL S-118]|uniref:chaplin family protein n=1 Tax=Streptomyces sp. NRRL S-118 TaxID=1463881 RepID=UPI0004C52457|nr:chaplin family protein [Streptomyces sp. NRRL S-118]